MRVSTLHLFIIFSCIGLFLMSFQCECEDEEVHDETAYTVEIGSEQDTYKINEPIKISSSMSSMIELVHAESMLDISGFSVGYGFKLFRVESDNEDATVGREDFTIVENKGSFSYPEVRTLEVEVDNTCDTQLCEFELELLPQETGYYGISMGVGGFSNGDPCTNYTLIPDGVDTDENNFSICAEINTTRLRVDNSFISDPSTNKLMYFFKVVE